MEHIELKEFIKNTLVEIAQGIRMANDELKNPSENQFEVFSLRRNKGDASKIPGIQFDVAVTAAKDQKDKAGFIITLINLGGGASTEKALSDKLVHRIKFEIGIDNEWK